MPVGIVYYIVQRLYVSSSRELKRLESISRSPIYSNFSETINGVSTIRAFQVEDRFISECESAVDYNQRAYFAGILTNRWLSIRLEGIGVLVVAFASFFAVIGRDTLTPGLVGLSVSYALQMTVVLNWMVRMSTSVENSMVSVERLKEYAEVAQVSAKFICKGKWLFMAKAAKEVNFMMFLIYVFRRTLKEQSQVTLGLKWARLS